MRKTELFNKIDGREFVHVSFERELEEMARLKQEKLYDLIHDERMKLLGELIEGLAHQLNNQLVGVVGFADILLNKLDKDDKNFHYAEVIKNAGEDCKEVVSKFFWFSKKQELSTFVQVDLRDLLDNSLVMVSKHSKIKKVRIEKNYTGSSSTWGAPLLLEQAFMSMLLNSVRGNGCNEGIRVECSTDKNGHTVVAIIGNSKEETEASSFRTSAPPFSTKGDGVSMNLPIAHWIIQAHGGKMSMEKPCAESVVFKTFIPCFARSLRVCSYHLNRGLSL